MIDRDFNPIALLSDNEETDTDMEIVQKRDQTKEGSNDVKMDEVKQDKKKKPAKVEKMEVDEEPTDDEEDKKQLDGEPTKKEVKENDWLESFYTAEELKDLKDGRRIVTEIVYGWDTEKLNDFVASTGLEYTSW